MARVPLVAGNWKMHGRLAMAQQLAGAVVAAAPAAVDVVLCPPYPYLSVVKAALAGSRLGLAAQNLAATEDGACTGEVSAAMLSDIGCGLVLVGHSERRSWFAETDSIVATKCRLALNAGLQPILCVGETLAERQADATEQVLARQLDAVLTLLGADAARLVIAYEPVWAIGTGQTASPSQAQAAHAFLRGRVGGALGQDQADTMRILYGGSVNADNAASLFAGADIDGGLIGGASLSAEAFLAVCQAAAV